MILIEKEWQDYKDTKTLYKIKVVAFFTLLINIGWHIYSFVLSGLESGFMLDFIHISEMLTSWGDALYVFNLTSVFFFLPIVILSNVGTVSRTKLNNSHFFATGVSKETMGLSKIALRVFIPILIYTFISFTTSVIANFLLDNKIIVIANFNHEVTLLELYLRPLTQIPFMMMCIAIALIAEQIGRDKLVSIFFFFIAFVFMFAIMGLSFIMREAIAEVMKYIFFQTATFHPQKFILGQLLFMCIFIIAFTLSVIRYARNKRI